MDAKQSIPELVAAARAQAQSLDAQGGETPEAIRALEAAAVDIFTVFEARMQHHFKRGPFSRKLQARLLEAGQEDLADRVYHYYLAVNVLKHGKGASYRELLKTPSRYVALRPEALGGDDAEQQSSLIDVRAEGFFQGLCATVLDAYDFLEAR